MADSWILTLRWPRATSSFLFAWPVRLSIAAGIIECETTTGIDQHRLIHRAPEVVITHSRLIPGIFGGTAVELVGERNERAAVQIRLGKRRARQALLSAGFAVRDQRRWLPSLTSWPQAWSPLNTIRRMARREMR
jgi:hypothetical protein